MLLVTVFEIAVRAQQLGREKSLRKVFLRRLAANYIFSIYKRREKM